MNCASRSLVLACAVLACACGGGSQLEPPRSPQAPSMASADASAPPLGWSSIPLPSEVPSMASADEAARLPVMTVATDPVTGGAILIVTGPEVAAHRPPGAVAAAPTVPAAVPATSPTRPAGAAVAAAPTAAHRDGAKSQHDTLAPSVHRPAVTYQDGAEPQSSDVDQLLAAVQRRWAPRHAATVDFFAATQRRVVLDACVGEARAGAGGYRHVQHVVDRRSAGWEIDATFVIGLFEDLDSCSSSFD